MNAFPDITFVSATPAEFKIARDKLRHPRKGSFFKVFLTPYTEAELDTMRLFLSEDKKTGYALTDNHELVNLFNAGLADAGKTAIVHAIKNGARCLNCFDGFLPKYYREFGFDVVRRVKWNNEYAPSDWDYATYGRPDIIYMERKEDNNAVELQEKPQKFESKERT